MIRPLARFVALLAFLFGVAHASTTSVTATLVDSDGTAWANCSWSAIMTSPKGGPTINRSPVTAIVVNGSCNSSGVLSATMTDTGSLDQPGAFWTFSIHPNASAGSGHSITTAITGTSVDLSAALSAGLVAPRFPAVNNAYGYANVEVTPQTPNAFGYYNVILQAQCVYNLGSWSCATSGSSPFQALTTTGTSGAATLTAGVLNVPQYTGGTGAVASVFGRTGVVTATNGDYTAAQVGAVSTSATSMQTMAGPINSPAYQFANVVSSASFGIVCDGATDNTTAFAAMDTYMVAHPGTTVEFNPGTGACQYHSSRWLPNVASGIIHGNGASFQNSIPYSASVYGTSMEFASQCDWFSCVPGASFTYPTYCPIQTAAAGATTITTITPSCAANIPVGSCLYLGGYNQTQGAGYPPDLRYNEWHCQIVSSNSSTGVITLQEPLLNSYDTNWLAGNPVNGVNMGPPFIVSLNRPNGTSAPFQVTQYLEMDDINFLCAVNFPSDCYDSTGNTSSNTGYGGAQFSGILNLHLHNVKIGYLNVTATGDTTVDGGSYIVTDTLDKSSGSFVMRDSTTASIGGGAQGFSNILIDHVTFNNAEVGSSQCGMSQPSSRQWTVQNSQFYCSLSSAFSTMFNLNGAQPTINAVATGNTFWNPTGSVHHGFGFGVPIPFTVLTVPTSLTVTYTQANYQANGTLIGNSIATTSAGKQCVVSAEPVASGGSMLLTFTSCSATPVIGDVFNVNHVHKFTEHGNNWAGVQSQMFYTAGSNAALMPVDTLDVGPQDFVVTNHATINPIGACGHFFTATTVGYGASATVLDGATSPTYLAAYTPGAGSTVAQVFCNGSNWVYSGGVNTGVSTVSVATANGISGTVANATTTPAITLTLGAITPTSVTTTGTGNGASTFTYTGVAATAPTTNQWQLSPAVAITTPWSLSPAGAPATGILYGTNTAGVVQQSFTTAPVLSAVNTNATQTTVSCSTSGNAVFSQPLQGASDKKVLIHFGVCLGTASYTFPVPFTNTPSIYASNNVAATIATSLTTTAVTVTGATTSGSLILEDY
jgi:hypothetical protein